MSYVPEHLQRWTAGAGASGWDSAANYSGEDLSDFYLAPIHRTHDTSYCLTLSNFRVIEAELDKLAQHEDTGVTRIGHWACGWYEIYLIHKSDFAALQCADAWACSLAYYPVADESDWSELESEDEAEAWERWGMAKWRSTVETALQAYAPEDSDVYWADEVLEGVSDDDLGALWLSVSERLGWTVKHGNDGPSFNFRDAREHLTAEVLGKLTGLALLPPDQEWRREPYPWAGADPSPLAPSLPVGS
jgi:hypothetical protein